MSDNLFTPRRWQWFYEQVKAKLGDEAEPEDVIDLVRSLEVDEVFDVDALRDWARDHDYVEGW